MAAPYYERCEHASVWRGSDPGFASSITWHLTEEEQQALLEQVDRTTTVARPPRTSGIDPATTRFRAISQDINHGRGIAIVKGVPIEGLSFAQIECLYETIGHHFGHAVSQSVMGDRIGHVTDISGKDANQRAYRNSLEIPLHTDRSDIVAMLSVRTAKEGGLSTYASVGAVHNLLLETNPKLLAPLYRGYRMHLFGEEPPGAAPVTADPVPVLSARDGLVSARIVPEYIDMAEVELGEPLAPLDREAVDTFLQVAASAQMRFDIMLEPGDLSLINNYAVLHARTLFDDYPEQERKRYLLRLWLETDDRRQLDEAMFEKGGIDQQPERENSYYNGDAARAANRGRYGEAVGLPEA
ncbi:MAG: hypothetical protein HOI95_08905 [Chromatiales bacterium]|jgi:hypothetical protein|nr:hypothetical protein [Chromatiales bacterium]